MSNRAPCVASTPGSAIRAEMFELVPSLSGSETTMSSPSDPMTSLKAREQALDRMVDEARGLGANAVIGTRFTTSMLMAGTAELLAYGTAVAIEDDARGE